MAVEKLITDHIDIWSSALQTRSTAGRGSNGKIDLYGIKKLRELILELAVRGKLVPQDPNDEPASELLKRIAAEKAELAKQGKIKKQKPLPEISEDDKPFELPGGWEWTTLKNICALENGDRSKNYPNKSTLVEFGVPFVNAGHLVNGEIDRSEMTFIKEEHFNSLRSGKFHHGDILFCLRGSLGKSALVENLSGAIASSLVIIRVFPLVDGEYVNLYFNTPLSYRYIKRYDNGTAQPNLAATDLERFLVPIPSFFEQKRIIAKINELMSLCDQLEQQSLTSLGAHQQLVETLLATLTDSQNAEELAENWARIGQHFDTLFTTEASIDALKQTILQLAVMGKLVPQDPNDEPASELLKRIEQEKAQLVKEGKIKKQKPLPPVSDEEKPFELPKGWEWCRLSALFSYITDGDHQAPPKASEGIPFLVIGNLNKGEVSFLDTKFVPNDYYHNLDWTKKPKSRDMLYTVTGSYGIPIIVNNDNLFCVQRHVAILKSCQYTPVLYLKSVFLTRYAFDFATKIATGIAQKTVPLTGLREMYIPLPPACEAKRIIEKIEIFDRMFLSLKSCLKSAQQTQLHLADALTDAALN